LAILFGGEGDIVDGHLLDNLLTIFIKIPHRLEVETEKL